MESIELSEEEIVTIYLALLEASDAATELLDDAQLAALLAKFEAKEE
jgi:hypothetical protein